MPSVEAMWQWAVDICNDDRYLYGGNRNSYASGGFYFDCSSFVNFALNAGGWETPAYAPEHGAFSTGTMGTELKRLGFTEYASNKITEYKPGDIGVTHTASRQHTEIFYGYDDSGNPHFMGAHTSSYPTAKQVSISDYSTSFNTIYRWEDESSGFSVTNYYVLAAMCGNFRRESFLCPNIWESGIVKSWTYVYDSNNPNQGGYGLGQWTNTNGDSHGRLYQMITWLEDNGYETTSGAGEAAYIVKENIWTQVYKNSSGETIWASDYSTLTEFMQSDSEDLHTLTADWMYCWERINGNLSERYESAQYYLEYLQEHIDDEDIKSWQLSNNNWITGITQSGVDANAVMLSRYMRDTYGIEGVESNYYDTGVTPDSQIYTENANVTGENVKSFSIWDLFYSMLGLIGGAGGKSRKLRIKRRR